MLDDTIFNLVKSIIGNPSNQYESIALYVLSCFIFIVIVKLTYDLLCYLFGIKHY